MITSIFGTTTTLRLQHCEVRCVLPASDVSAIFASILLYLGSLLYLHTARLLVLNLDTRWLTIPKLSPFNMLNRYILFLLQLSHISAKYNNYICFHRT